jgi:hypothetical protein
LLAPLLCSHAPQDGLVVSKLVVEGRGTIKYKVVLKITLNRFNNIMKTRKM